MKNNNLPEISDAEFEIVNVLWTVQEKMSALEIIEALKDCQVWSPKTVKTMLFRLVKKGVLDFEEVRREYFYFPKFERADYLHKEGTSFLKKLFQGATGSMVMHFLSSSKLSKNEISEIKTLLAQIEREAK